MNVAELERVDLARAVFTETMLADVVQVEAHRVVAGDAICCVDGEWRPVLALFGENSATASATVWAIYAYADWDSAPTQRIAGSPSEAKAVRRQ